MSPRSLASASSHAVVESAQPVTRTELAKSSALQAAGARAVQAQVEAPIAHSQRPEDFDRQVRGEAFVHGAGDANAIDANDVHQNLDTNDCWLLSTLMAIARINPGLVQSMVQPAGEGAWNVSFYSTDWTKYFLWQPGQPSPPKHRKTVRVTAEFPIDRAGVPGFANFGDVGAAGPELWVMLIEKAIAADLGGYAALSTATSDTGLFALTPDPLEGPGTARGISSITVSEVTADQLLDKLATAHDNGSPIVAASNGNTPSNFLATNAGAIAARGQALQMPNFSHAFNVTSVNRQTRTIGLAEPTGSVPVSSLSIDDFKLLFNDLAIGAPIRP